MWCMFVLCAGQAYCLFSVLSHVLKYNLNPYPGCCQSKLHPFRDLGCTHFDMCGVGSFFSHCTCLQVWLDLVTREVKLQGNLWDVNLAPSGTQTNALLSTVSCTDLRVQRLGIEPRTSAVLKPRHNQLDHLCWFHIKTHFLWHIIIQTSSPRNISYYIQHKEY